MFKSDNFVQGRHKTNTDNDQDVEKDAIFRSNFSIFVKQPTKYIQLSL